MVVTLRRDTPVSTAREEHQKAASTTAKQRTEQRVDATFLGQPGPQTDHWTARAACREIGSEPFFGELGGESVADYAQARRVCRRCEVRADCLDFALRLDIRDGLYGGLTPRQRRNRQREAS